MARFLSVVRLTVKVSPLRRTFLPVGRQFSSPAAITCTRTLGSAMGTENAAVEQIRRSFSNPELCPLPISAYIIPHEDQHMSEYLADTDKRLEYVSGFTGSAGTVVITIDKALLWTDGRYFIQANNEMKPPFELMKVEDASPSPGEWLASKLSKKARVGGDPSLFSCTQWLNAKKELKTNLIELVAIEINLVDRIWENKPLRPVTTVDVFKSQYSGQLSRDKVLAVVAAMEGKGADVHVVSELDNVAWLLNLRGSDIPYNPVFFSFVVVQSKNGQALVDLFIDKAKLTAAVVEHLKTELPQLKIRNYSEVYSVLSELALQESTNNVWISTTSNYKLLSMVPKEKRSQMPSVVTKLKAVKNPVEAEGMVQSHIRDGYALSSFLLWLEENVPDEKTTEIIAATKLQCFRSQEEAFRGLSFPTISSFGDHAAIIHYQPAASTDRLITTKEIYLVDSGGQYWDGTTDVTRTVHFGTPTEFEKECFTRVLKGVISLNTAIFPAHLRGNVLDSFARRSLWDVGLQYDHGTGHGIGAHLCVHEGPIGVSWRALPNDPGLDANMFISNEPGYYKENCFGIRIENIEQIVSATPKYETQRKFLTLKTITMCPIQAKLITAALLTEDELKWVNDYHAEVRKTLVPIAEMRGNVPLKTWLLASTAPIEKPGPPSSQNSTLQ